MANTDGFAGTWRKSIRSGHGGNCVEVTRLERQS